MAFPTTSVLDDFNGTPGDDLSVHLSDWDAITFILEMEIQDSAATAITDGSNNANIWGTETFGPDSEAFATFNLAPKDGAIAALGVRSQEVGSGATIDGYWIIARPVSGTDTFTLERLDNGALTQLGSSLSQEMSDGDGFGIEIVSDTLTAYYYNGTSWSALGNTDDSTYTSDGNLLIFTNDDSVRLDDFGGGTLISGATVVLGQGIVRSFANVRASNY